MYKRAFLTWIEEGVISIPSFLFTYYKQIGLTDVECMLLLHIQTFLDKGKEFPTIEELSERMVLTKEQCSQTIRSLIQRGYLEILNGKTIEGIYYEKYSLKPLWERIVEHHNRMIKGEKKEQKRSEEGELFTIFEQEFARPLSPIECETLSMWLDKDGHSPALIKAALKEAVLSGKRSFRYIDRILFEWKKSGVKTVEEAQEKSRIFRLNQQKRYTAKSNEPQKGDEQVPFYNWLEN